MLSNFVIALLSTLIDDYGQVRDSEGETRLLFLEAYHSLRTLAELANDKAKKSGTDEDAREALILRNLHHEIRPVLTAFGSHYQVAADCFRDKIRGLRDMGFLTQVH